MANSHEYPATASNAAYSGAIDASVTIPGKYKPMDSRSGFIQLVIQLVLSGLMSSVVCKYPGLSVLELSSQRLHKQRKLFAFGLSPITSGTFSVTALAPNP